MQASKKSKSVAFALLGSLLAVTGCGVAPNAVNSPTNTSPSSKILPGTQSGLPPRTFAGFALKPLPDAQLGVRPVWSTSGNDFAYPIPSPAGTAGAEILGSVEPFAKRLLHLPQGDQIVALMSKYVIVTSYDANQDWLYPIKSGLHLGNPIPWTASTDTWQEWVSTDSGPAIVTGGYTPGSLDLTWKSGHTLALRGGEVYISGNRRLGAVVSRSRPHHLVHPNGDVADLSEHQPANVTNPISVWNFTASGGPRRVSVLKLINPTFPRNAGSGVIQNIVFSPNNQKVAVLVQSEFATGPELLGQTEIFSVTSGKLLGVAPYGNGMAWLPNSQGLWLGTSKPAGQGEDRIVNLQGETVAKWQDANGEQVVPVQPDLSILFQHGSLGIQTIQRSTSRTSVTSSSDVSFTPFQGYDNLGFNGKSISPSGKSALIMFETKVALLSLPSSPSN